jgi:Domain of unknown function (DUF3472)/Domain of unknown function (DUF5077)
MIGVFMRLVVLVLFAYGSFASAAEPSLSIPAFTAYIQPDPNGLKVSEKSGVDGWSDAKQQIAWHGRFANAGALTATVSVVLPAGQTSTLRLDVDGQTKPIQVTGAGDVPVKIIVDGFTLRAAGWHHLVLTGMAKSGTTFGRVTTLDLAGPATVGAHFNLKSRRNCASVHLGYPLPKDAGVTAFYNEVTVRTDPLWSYYMACGFSRGYFGIQVNSPTERRVIFSVWDSGNEAVDRAKVAEIDRVKLLGKGDGVVASDFGNEGTGGHSHLVYPWVVGNTYRFLVTAKPEGTTTTYTGWFFFPERKAWGMIASFRAPKDGKPLHGLYSFNECFNGQNGDQRRLAEFGNQWVLNNGAWQELTTARFTHDVTGGKDRIDYESGVTDGRRFFLSNGGWLGSTITTGTTFSRPALGQQPNGFPALPGNNR